MAARKIPLNSLLANIAVLPAHLVTLMFSVAILFQLFARLSALGIVGVGARASMTGQAALMSARQFKGTESITGFGFNFTTVVLLGVPTDWDYAFLNMAALCWLAERLA